MESPAPGSDPLAIDTRQRACCGCCGGAVEGNGILSGSGLLVANLAVGMSNATDGTVNQMLLAEGSDWGYTDPANKTGKNYLDHGHPHGWPMGTEDGTQITGANRRDSMHVFST